MFKVSSVLIVIILILVAPLGASQTISVEEYLNKELFGGNKSNAFTCTPKKQDLLCIAKDIKEDSEEGSLHIGLVTLLTDQKFQNNLNNHDPIADANNTKLNEQLFESLKRLKLSDVKVKSNDNNIELSSALFTKDLTDNTFNEPITGNLALKLDGFKVIVDADDIDSLITKVEDVKNSNLGESSPTEKRYIKAASSVLSKILKQYKKTHSDKSGNIVFTSDKSLTLSSKQIKNNELALSFNGLEISNVDKSTVNFKADFIGAKTNFIDSINDARLKSFGFRFEFKELANVMNKLTKSDATFAKDVRFLTSALSMGQGMKDAFITDLRADYFVTTFLQTLKNISLGTATFFSLDIKAKQSATLKQVNKKINSVYEKNAKKENLDTYVMTELLKYFTIKINGKDISKLN